MSHVIDMDESCHRYVSKCAYQWVIAFAAPLCCPLLFRFSAYTRVTSHVWKTLEYVTLHRRMSHVTHTNESRHTYYVWVILNIWMRTQCNTLQHNVWVRHTVCVQAYGWYVVGESKARHMCCNTLQHTATHCNTLERVWRGKGSTYVLHHTATHCNTLQLVWRDKGSTYVLQHTATYCNVFGESKAQHMCSPSQWLIDTAPLCNALQHTAIRCNTLQHTATHCNTLHYTAPHCTTLHHTATWVCRLNGALLLQQPCLL